MSNECELCGEVEEYCSECGTCSNCLEESRTFPTELTPSDLAQLAARHGLVLVPLEPTEKMILEGLGEVFGGADLLIDDIPQDVYKAMIEVGKVDG